MAEYDTYECKTDKGMTVELNVKALV